MAEKDRKDGDVMISKKKQYFVVVVCILLILLGLIFIIYGSIEYKSESDRVEVIDRVGVVIDAGGSGTRMIIYRYANDTFKQLKYKKCEKRGLARYSEEDFPALKALLSKCLAEGAAMLPTDKKVPIYVAATAGMRLLKLRDVVAYNKIWKLVRECLKESEFQSAKVNTISGSEEAKWAWVAANLLKRTLQDGGGEQFGTIDFGSSSIQIAFERRDNASAPTDEIIQDKQGNNISIYAHSYLCFGVVEMERRFLAKLVKNSNYTAIVQNPCYFNGYVVNVTSEYLWGVPCSSGNYSKHVLGEEISGPVGETYKLIGSGNFSQCFKILNNLIGKVNCTKKEGLCGINNNYQPRVHGKFLALSMFYFISDFLGLKTNSNEKDYYDASNALCARNWGDVSNGTAPIKYVLKRCFQSVYGYYLLTNGFKFDNTTWKVDYVNSIDGSNVGWSLGLIYTYRDGMYTRVKHFVETVVNQGFIAMIVIGPICLLVGLILAYVAYKGKQRHFMPNSKTVT